MMDVENKEFWVKSIKHSVIKRMVDRGYTDAVKISNVVDLEIEEVKKIIELKKSYIYFLDKKLRFDCLMYYSYDLYNNSLKKKVLDFSPEYFLEFTGGKGSIFRVWNESGSEFEEIQNGCDLAHNLALLKLIELKYSSEDIVKILGSDEVKKFKKNYSLGTDSLSYRISIHSKNKGIRYKHMSFFLICLLLKII